MESPKELSFSSDASSTDLNSSYHDYSFNGLPLTKLNVNSYLFFSSNLNSIAKQQKSLLGRNQMQTNSLNYGQGVSSVGSLGTTFQQDRLSRINDYLLNSTPLKVSTDNHGFKEVNQNATEDIRSSHSNNSLLMITKHRSASKDIKQFGDSAKNTSQNLPAINKRAKSTYPFGKCKVCNDKATGIHYGIATCEGCKGFFKRCTLKKEMYTCFFGNDCIITPKNRNRCKSCRFKKCLDVNMSIQGAKMGRIPKAVKEQAIKRFNELNFKTETDSEKPNEHFCNNSVSNDATKDTEYESQMKSSASSDSQCDLASPSFQYQSHKDYLQRIVPLSDVAGNAVSITNQPDEYTDLLSNLKITTDNNQHITGRKILRRKSLEHFSHNQIDELNLTSIEKLLISQDNFPFNSSASLLAERGCSFSNFKISFDRSDQVILSLLGDKTYQLLAEKNRNIQKLQEHALSSLFNDIDQKSVNFSDVWSALLKEIPKMNKNFLEFINQLPGLKDLSDNDFGLIARNKIFEYFLLHHAPLFMNNDCFLFLQNNIHYSRKWMNQFAGTKFTDDLFRFCNELNRLKLTVKESALIIPVVITTFTYDDTFDDPNTMRSLNQYYYKTLIYELDLNKRSTKFVQSLEKVNNYSEHMSIK